VNNFSFEVTDFVTPPPVRWLANMKNKQTKIVKNPEVMVRTELVLDAWWGALPASERMILYALAQSIDRVTEKREMMLSKEGDKLSLGLIGAYSNGSFCNEIASFPKPEFFKDAGEQTVNDLWLELSAHEQKLAIGLTKALLGEGGRVRWN
jgi:hypothetical protein